MTWVFFKSLFILFLISSFNIFFRIDLRGFFLTFFFFYEVVSILCPWLWGSGLTWVDLYFFFSFTIQYLDCLIMEFYNFIQFAFINDFFNFLLTQIIVWLNKTFILKNKVIKHNWVHDPCCKIKYFYLSYFLIKYQFIQLNIIYDWKSFCVQKKKGWKYLYTIFLTLRKLSVWLVGNDEYRIKYLKSKSKVGNINSL